MTEIPRKPTFPLHMIEKLLLKIQSDVNDDVIPVSTGIYSLQKLKNKLEAIPKPQIENYDDKIFFEVIQDRLSPLDKSGEKCPACEQQYNMKKNPAIMCNFCAFYCCSNCIPVRKRPHPLSKDPHGKRYNICQRCDTKYLNLQLGHSYVQNRTLLQQAIAKTTQQLENLSSQCKDYQQILSKSKQTFEKNKFKIAQLKKEKLQLNKDIKTKLPQEIRVNDSKTENLKLKFVSVHLRHKEWLELAQSRKRIWEQERQRLRVEIQQKQRQQERQNLRRLKQKQELQQAERIQKEKRQFQIKQKERQRQKQQQRQRQRQRQRELKLKKAPSLSQNTYLNMNLSYINNPRAEQREEDEKRIQQKQIIQVDQIINYKEPEKLTIIEGEKADTRILLSIDQQKHQQPPLSQQPVIINHNNDASNQYFAQHQINQMTSASNYTFTENAIDHLKPQESTWHYHEKERKLSQHIEIAKDSQALLYSFDPKEQQKSVEQIVHQDKQIQQQQYIQGENDQDNHLSFIDQWYVNTNKQGTIPQNQSTLSTVMNTQPYERTYFAVKEKKTLQELEEECVKSTSELDEEELQVARYSLIKAARDSAVQQRQKNKIYQRSVHDIAPYDQEQEAVGQVKKCQCLIY